MHFETAKAIAFVLLFAMGLHFARRIYLFFRGR